MLVQEVIDHCDGFLGVLTLGRPMECHAAVGVCTARDEVIEELYVAVRGDDVEDLQREVMPTWCATKATFVVSIFIRLVDIRTVVKKPVEGFSVMRKVPGSLSVKCGRMKVGLQ
jgi:hypothetical protein